jgi:hypothetical protein
MQVTHEEMGKRKCKLQKGRDKPMEPENVRRLEEKARKAPTSGKGEKKVSKEQWADFSKKMTEMEVAYYKPIAEQDYEHHMIKEDLMPCSNIGVPEINLVKAITMNLQFLLFYISKLFALLIWSAPNGSNNKQK